ncbi:MULTISPECIES: hypothetical protein [unclassified Sphingomonas]|uniref:hypothetical protein n=1 Tax=unclassified Sphingomonas TaxID=196159 RepID=UPI002269D680|nr:MULTISPECIES: hypothetical protein [unclassified Sphingomonas]
MTDSVPLPRTPPLPWIRTAPGAPYFIDDTGANWTPIGQNDAITWPELAPLFRRRDLAAVERHLAWLVEHGVTCLRLMVEYAQVRHRYFERPAGVRVPAMVRLWDDLFALCERAGLRILLTPVDTFWMWIHWRHHPWNAANGGPLDTAARLLLSPELRQAIKARLTFMAERWGGSGALFAWDLWNEIHPAQAENGAACFDEFIADLSQHVRGLEQRLYGRSHPQTVSIYGPELWWRPELAMAEPIFRHPDLDFATIHIYRSGPIDNPTDTVRPALAMGRVVRQCLGEITDTRPFLDTEHGPIHAFKDKHRTLPAPFDDEYFRHMSWAHLASGGVGGGMRWPNRHPHVLTPGMRLAQRAMSGFLPLIDWQRFRRTPFAVRVRSYHALGCGDADQAVLWLVRRGGRMPDGRVDNATFTLRPITVPMPPGRFRVTIWDTIAGQSRDEREVVADEHGLAFDVTVSGDCAVAIRRI